MSPQPPADPSRRSLLCTALGAGAVVVGATLLAPPLVVLVAPALEPRDEEASGGASRWVDVGPAGRFEVGAPPRRVVLRAERRDAWRVESGVTLGTIWVQRPAPTTFLVHSAACTHLGCAVDFRDAGFVCPCHGARFAPDGSLAPLPDGTPNPAPRALDVLAWRVEEGHDHLHVAWQRFALNVADKLPAGGGDA